MILHWTDIQEIAEALMEEHPQLDPKLIRFQDLHRYVCSLLDFQDDPKRSNERILEAIQAAWIDLHE